MNRRLASWLHQARHLALGRPVRRWLMAAALSGASGCLLEQDLGHDLPVDLAMAADVAQVLPRPDAAELRDLVVPPDRAVAHDLACANERTFCEGACRNLNLDPNHCGACRAACAPMQICVMAHCDGCPRELTPCENHCVPLSSDANNCGACGRVCAMGRSCVAGVCV